MEYQVVTRRIPDQRVVSIRRQITRPELSAFIGTSYDTLFQRLGGLRIEPVSEPLVIYHAWEPDVIDAEVCVPIAEGRPVSGGIVDRIVPGATVAQTLHVGRYEDLLGAYQAVAAWIAVNGGHAAGPARERYLVGMDSGVAESQFRTLVETPIVEAAVVAG